MTMKIAVASGKGGTGKTMVATSLALSLAALHQPIKFLDCDVEAPDAHLFLKPVIEEEQPAVLNIPVIDKAACTLCRRCVEICEFNALAKLGENILVFPQLCHGCGSCTLQCPEEAIHEEEKPIGLLRHGHAKPHIDYYEGELTISEPMPTPIIRQLKHFASEQDELTILDSPPGASCSVVATINDADFVILVTEPTPFGLHDLKQMLGILEKTKSPAGVIINRDGIGDGEMGAFLTGTPYPIMMRIPYEREIAAGLAAGRPLIDIKPAYKNTFKTMFNKWIAPHATEKGSL